MSAQAMADQLTQAARQVKNGITFKREDTKTPEACLIDMDKLETNEEKAEAIRERHCETTAEGRKIIQDAAFDRYLARVKDQEEKEKLKREVAKRRAERDGAVWCCNRYRKIPVFLLIMRDVFMFSIIGLGAGIAVDYVFSLFATTTNIPLFFFYAILQLNINAWIIYCFILLYQFIWFRNPNTYLGYTSFVTIMYMCQIHLYATANDIFIQITGDPNDKS